MTITLLSVIAAAIISFVIGRETGAADEQMKARMDRYMGKLN